MNYEQSQKYLESLGRFGIKLGLENIQTLLNSFGQPQNQFPSILVAGTNGKGSVCAMLTEILSRHHFRVGFYSSPHLISVEERFRIGRKCISRQDLCVLLTQIRERIDELLARLKLATHPTFFEVLTCLAFLYFQKKQVDIAVLEVGMGGRFDATNVVTPLVSVITSVSKDHQMYLGNTLRQIAFEKAGIIKPGVPLICGVSKGVAYRVIQRRAEELGAPFFGVFDNKGCFEAKRTDFSFLFFYKFGDNEFLFSPSLRGEHQGRNGAVAIATASVLSRVWRKLDREQIIAGVEGARWEGRLEVVSQNPLIILDGAHNEEGARCLASYIKDFLSMPLAFVFACMRDKDLRKIARILFPLAERIFITHIPFSRAASPQEIRAAAEEFGEKIVLEPNLKLALKMALDFAKKKEGGIVATGSLFLIGEIKKGFLLF